MDGSRALLIDLFNFLESVEARIMTRRVDLSNALQITNLNHVGSATHAFQCFSVMDSILKQCENTISTQDLHEIKERINAAREAVAMLEGSATVKETDLLYGDLYLTQELESSSDYADYGRHLGISNEEFDKMVEEWAEDRDTSQKGQRMKRGSKAETFQEQIKGEMAQLADAMKSKALRYRDIIVKDNKALLKFTGEQEKQLDTVTHVAKESSKLAKSANLSLMQLAIMVLSMFGLTMVIMFVFLIT